MIITTKREVNHQEPITGMVSKNLVFQIRGLVLNPEDGTGRVGATIVDGVIEDRQSGTRRPSEKKTVIFEFTKKQVGEIHKDGNSKFELLLKEKIVEFLSSVDTITVDDLEVLQDNRRK